MLQGHFGSRFFREMALSCFLLVFLSLPSSHAFLGMMNPFAGGPAQIFDESAKMGLDLCDKPMSSFGARMFNAGSDMVAMMPMIGNSVRGMEQNISRELMVRVLSKPESTLKALRCALSNQGLIPKMLQTLSANPELLHYLGGAMIMENSPSDLEMSRNIAFTMFNLALQKPQLGRFLLRRVDTTLYKQLTHALIKHPGLVEAMTELVFVHRHETLSMTSPLMTVMTSWGVPGTSQVSGSDSDGVEMATERMLFSVFSNVRAANRFMEAIQSIGGDLESAVMDTLMLGKVYRFNPMTRNWTTNLHSRQSSYNLYAMMYGLNLSVVEPQNSKDPDKVKASAEAKGLMENMMRYMVDDHKRPTYWGMAFAHALVNGAMYHRDENLNSFAQFLVAIMPPDFQRHLPMPDLNSPAPRAFIDDDPPIIPQKMRLVQADH